MSKRQKYTNSGCNHFVRKNATSGPNDISNRNILKGQVLYGLFRRPLSIGTARLHRRVPRDLKKRHFMKSSLFVNLYERQNSVKSIFPKRSK